LNEKVLIAVVRVSETYKKDCSSIFRNYGLTFAQYTVLRVLEASVDGRNTMSNVGRVMLVSGANMTGIAKRLEKSGFLVRKKDPSDDRLTILEITSKGHQALADIELEKNGLLERYLEGYTDDRKKDLLEGLKKILYRTNSVT
jgi:DNA-binding MarR family transcriptional regulator